MAVRSRWKFVGVALALPALVACSSSIRKPRIMSPGTASLQRHNANQFDPYPPNDLGPEISGGRPIDSLQPRNEVTRSRQHLKGERALATPGTAPVVSPIAMPATFPTTYPATTVPGVPTIPVVPTTPYTVPAYPTTPPALPSISNPRY